MMPVKRLGRLAIHRRADEIAFLQHWLSTCQRVPPADKTSTWEIAAWERQQALADELLHTRQTEPLGETLQRRLAMAERVSRDLSQKGPPQEGDPQWVALVEREALANMLAGWWAWLKEA